MTYTTKEALINRIDRIITGTVKHYMSDWTELDRPKLIRWLASDKRDDKQLLLIARDCGTYLLRMVDVNNKEHEASVINEYYREQEDDSCKFYMIDLNRMQIKTA